MDAVNSWDVALFAVAGYIAVVSLVRLMIGRRNALASELRAELEQERRRLERLEKQKQESQPAKPARGGRPAA